jgi:hypothetical protein
MLTGLVFVARGVRTRPVDYHCAALFVVFMRARHLFNHSVHTIITCPINAHTFHHPAHSLSNVVNNHIIYKFAHILYRHVCTQTWNVCV